MGDPAVLRVDGGGWRAQMSAAELDARVVEDVAGGLGIEVAMSGAAAERLRAVTVVGRGATMTIRICGVVIARPILWEPIETGRLAIMGAATTRMAAEAWVAALNGATPCPEP